jgi:hypothetical protein
MNGPAIALEEELLLRAAKLRPSADDLARAREIVADPRFSWEDALAAAVDSRVHTLLARSVEDAPALRAATPPAVRRALAQARLAATLRTARAFQAVEPVLAALAARGVPAILLKGAALAATILPPGARVLQDLDILVPVEARARAIAAFEANGFRRPGRLAAPARGYHEVELVKRVAGGAAVVDLHWRLYPRGRAYSIPWAELRARARPVVIEGAPALASSLEDTFVHYATQLGNDKLEVGFRRATDLDALARSGLDWRRAAAIARAAGASGAARLALGLAAMLGAEPPGWLLRSLERECPGSGLLAELLAAPALLFGRRTLRPGARAVLLPCAYGRLRDRLAYAFTIAAPAYGSARDLHVAPNGGEVYAARIRAVAKAAACGAAVLVWRGARALGAEEVAGRAFDALCPPGERGGAGRTGRAAAPAPAPREPESGRGEAALAIPAREPRAARP